MIPNVRHPGEGRDPRQQASILGLSLAPAFAGVTVGNFRGGTERQSRNTSGFTPRPAWFLRRFYLLGSLG